MLQIMKIQSRTDSAILQLEDCCKEVATTEKAKQLMQNGELAPGRYAVIKIHGEFSVKEERQIIIEPLNVGDMTRA